MNPTPIAELRPLCVHCGSEVPARRRSRFCCLGCEAVYRLLNERGLGTYYEIRDKGRSVRAASPASSLNAGGTSFAYLDDPDFLKLYSFPTPRGKGMRFYLEGAHCAACVWLTERVGQFVSGVDFLRLDLSNSLLSVNLEPSGSFAAVAQELARFGYRPHPVRAEEIGKWRKKGDHLLLAQTGVAAACAGNIMLLSTSLYAGAGGSLATVFRWACLALAVPVLTFSALPFYRNAYAAIRAKQVSIDIPIALGIAIGAISSLYNLITGSPYLYFDSLAMLVFLMLASRYFLRRTQESAASSSKLIHFLTSETARVREAGMKAFREVAVDRIAPGQEVEVLPGDCLPVDGAVLEGASSLNNSLLTGESRLVQVEPGDPVFAGTVNGESALVIRATAAGSATRLGRILKAVDEDLSKKARITSYADRIAKGFVAAVLAAVAAVFVIGLRHGLHEAVDLALALSIVTCPCAFALATPLALSISLGNCAKRGILIKGEDTLEKLSEVDSVFFDKTGTLTHGSYEVLGVIGERELIEAPEFAGALAALESRSRHPIAHAIVDYFGAKAGAELPPVSDFREIAGRGVSGRVGGHEFEIRAFREAAGEVSVFRDGRAVARIRLGDGVRGEAADTVTRLRKLGLQVGVLSGDSIPAVEKVAKQIGLGARWKAELSPEEKRAEIQKSPRALMIGDGANDANALAAAFVGVAVHGGMEVSLRSSDVYCRKPGVAAIPALITLSRETMRVIRRNFAFSLVYNLIGVAGVLAGIVTPLFAAILMPISAMTVFLSSIAGTASLRRALKEMSR